MIESPVERLVKTHPDMEIWWDSSPLVYQQWTQKMLNTAEPSRRPVLKDQLARLYNADAPAQSVFRGCTTNPPLSWQAIQSDPDFWGDWIDALRLAHPEMELNELTGSAYKEVVKRGAQMYLPIFEASRGRFGWISGQLDPRLFTETDRMVRDAEELSALSPNVMIKVPASTQGIEVVRILTSRGISTNTTVCFTLPQILASANAAMEGIKIAGQNNVDLSRWRAVITMMMGRLTEHEVLDLQAERRNMRLSLQEKRWLGIAVFRRAYRILTEGGYASKLLACSMRVGPLVAGKMRFWDVQKLAGGDIVYTCPPYVLEPLFEIGEDLLFEPEIEEEVPREVMDKLLKIPYCVQAYDPNGLELEQFNDHPATISTVENFSKGFAGLEGFIGTRMAASHQAEKQERPSIM
ncbi:MAG TPA: transaldolase family protein [Anaerolineales bacterium]|nr:transaldolase family protein [Anaerolineales bacterium]